MKDSISAVIITLNESRNIVHCIEALRKVTDDIVIVDSESKDDTVSLAESHGARIFVRKWDGYGNAKNFGIDQANNDWILSIDADEYLSPKLQQSLTKLNLDLQKVYALDILPNYCGKWIRYGSWYPDWNIRLFNRKSVRWSNDEVHESLIGIEAKTEERIKGELYHYSYRTIEEHQVKMDRYAYLGAKDQIKRGISPGFFKKHFSPLMRFLKSYVLRLGFLDGFYGYVIAVNEMNMVRARNKYFRELQSAKDPSE